MTYHQHLTGKGNVNLAHDPILDQRQERALICLREQIPMKPIEGAKAVRILANAKALKQALAERDQAQK